MEMQFWWGFAFAIQGSEELGLLCLLRAEEEMVGKSFAGSAPETAAPCARPGTAPAEPSSPPSAGAAVKRSPYQGMRSGKTLSHKTLHRPRVQLKSHLSRECDGKY